VFAQFLAGGGRLDSIAWISTSPRQATAREFARSEMMPRARE
jgi:hypothetical protein